MGKWAGGQVEEAERPSPWIHEYVEWAPSSAPGHTAQLHGDGAPAHLPLYSPVRDNRCPLRGSTPRHRLGRARFSHLSAVFVVPGRWLRIGEGAWAACAWSPRGP